MVKAIAEAREADAGEGELGFEFVVDGAERVEGRLAERVIRLIGNEDE
jgi:hypothetical protein